MNWVSPFPENKPYVIMAKVNYIWLIADFEARLFNYIFSAFTWLNFPFT